MNLLSIETSCDECSAAVLVDSALKSVIISSQLVHNEYGGVVPELASRAHIEMIVPVVEEALKKSSISKNEIDAVAVTYGPGLAGSLIVGLSFAKSFAASRGIPVVGVNHIEGHLYSSFLENDKPQFPFLALIVSGGHTMLVHVKEPYSHELLGQTRDDAAGEAYDKVAKLLGLGYPGGPVIDKLAKEGNPEAFKFPRAFINDDSFEFSFSGLKTSVLYLLRDSQNASRPEKYKQTRRTVGGDGADERFIRDICASFQRAVVDVLVEKAIAAAVKFSVRSITVAGGVAANSELRGTMAERAHSIGAKVFFPRPLYCTDNAAMIGIAAHFKYKKFGIISDFMLKPVPNLTFSSELSL
ncbi:MAG TPA: tRNA (adenosine(37)-N6)-threonylcarbamoyltransferase complex transferase subunit TsaD [Candidatus Acidoferrales bacterium]|nr:tRNA (adenosine(37)-N6)-threonylcarbamoyltransferase complex transferase subunit TsaD [Candidatus Acidoferrales bacterium]